MIRNKLRGFTEGGGVLAPRPTPKLEDHPLSAVRDCLFNIFAPNIPPYPEAVSSIRNLRTRYAVVTRDPLNMVYHSNKTGYFKNSFICPRKLTG
jgi:hypothetical protein